MSVKLSAQAIKIILQNPKTPKKQDEPEESYESDEQDEQEEDILNNPFYTPMYNEEEDILAKAEELGLKEAITSPEKPECDWLTEQDWEGLAGFDDMVKKLPLAGSMTLSELQCWLKEKQQKKTRKYRSIWLSGGGLC